MTWDIVSQVMTPILSGGLVLVVLRLWLSDADRSNAKHFSTIKESTDIITRRLDCYESNIHACQLNAVKTYALKIEHDSLDRKVDEHDGRLTRVETRVYNGSARQ